jgi:hypothetical protein
MKNLKHIFTSFLLFFGLGQYLQEKDKSLPLANEEYADNKFVDAEANYRVQIQIPK